MTAATYVFPMLPASMRSLGRIGVLRSTFDTPVANSCSVPSAATIARVASGAAEPAR